MAYKNIEITIFSGTEVWKGGYEYYREDMILSGYPYYQITRVNDGVNDVYYFWELDLDDADRGTYRIRKTSNDYDSLREEGLALDRAIGEKYKTMNLYFTKGKKLIEKLRSK